MTFLQLCFAARRRNLRAQYSRRPSLKPLGSHGPEAFLSLPVRVSVVSAMTVESLSFVVVFV